MGAPTNIALKEWSVLCHELEAGRQVFLLKKGGIHDRRKEFEMDHRAFWLFPTYYHAKPEELVPEVHGTLERLTKAAPPESEVHLQLYCEVTGAKFVEDLATLHRLKGLHVYSEDTVDSRYHYRRPGVWVVTTRVYKLPGEVVTPNTDEYAGCVSWVSLDDAVDPAKATPVLGEAEFKAQTQKLAEIIGGLE